MRRSPWTLRLAAPVAALTAVTGVGLAVAAVATPDSAVPAADAAGTVGVAYDATVPPTSRPITTKPTGKPTTKPTKSTKVKGPACKPGCTLLVHDFETGSQGWTGPDGVALGVTTEVAASGEQALATTRISGATGPTLAITSQRLVRPKGQRYLVSLWFKVVGPVSGKPVTLDIDGVEQATSESVVPTGAWQQLRATFVPSATSLTLTVVEGAGDPCRGYPKVMQSVSLDDVSVGVPARAVTVTPTTSPTGPPTCTTRPTTTTPTPTSTKPDLTCTAIDMPVTDGPGSTVTIRNLGPTSLADWTVVMTTGLKPVKVSPGLWSYADGVVTVLSPPNQGAVLAGQSFTLYLEGGNGSEILPYPVSLNGVNCAVAMP